MQLPLSFLLLFFLFLFAHRIKTSSGENIGHSDNVWDNNDNEVEQLSTDDNDDQPSAGECSKSQFQCVSNGKCIEKYMFCDYIVDCEDGSDEIKCGTCNFQNGSTCGWKDASGVKDGWKVVNGNFMTTPPVTQFGHFKLTSPNLHGIGYFCQMVLHINIASKNAKTKLYVAHQIPNSEQNFRSYTFKDMIQKQDWTEVVVPIRTAPSGALSDNHGTYTIDIGAMLYDAGDKITIKEIHFENCNPKRTIGDCDFEDNNLCHWNLNKDRSVIPWIIGRGDQVNETYAPTADHTLGSGAGHFVWTSIGSANSSQSVPVAVLTSIPLDFRVCVSFWYFMDGASFLQLSITDQIVSSNTSRNDALMSSPTGAMWRYKQADIMYRGATFMVNIEAQIEDASGVIAIDDILMKFGGCTNSPICDFETDSCGFQLFKSDNSTWQRIQSRTMQNLTSMTFNDHTTGTLNGYMMLFIPRTDGDMSWFTSPESDFSGYRCLQFYYYISDDNVGTLEVSHHSGFGSPGPDIDSEKNGYIRRSQSTLLLTGFWRKITLTLVPVDESVYDFIATAGSDVNNGFIAIDDIQVTNGKCRAPVSCDFEYDNCGWYLDQDYSMTPFERQSPTKRRRNYCLGPQTDHTLQTKNGHYLYFCYHNSDQLMATIKSDDFDGTKNWCFSFWAYFTNVTNIRVDVYLITIDGSTQIAAINGENSTDWKYHEVSITGSDKYEINLLSVSVTPYDFIANQGVAIDDMKLSPFKCGYKPKPKDPNRPGGKRRPKEKEIPEFSCNFELNECNYQLDKSHGTSFEVLKANSNNNRRQNAPVVDHTYHAYDGGFLELQQSDKFVSNGKYAVLAAKSTLSPSKLSNDSDNAQVCVHFWYVMNGEAVNWLNVSTMSSVDNSIQTVSHLEGTFGPTWRHKLVPITFYDDFYLYFIGSSSSFKDGVLALDDISVSLGPCPIEPYCDFSFDSCGWDNNVSLPLRWQIQSAFMLAFVASVNSTAPINDHTTKTQYGNYMYLNASFDSRGQTAQLISPVTRPDKKCLQFWYYFYGKNVGSLNVYVVYNGLVNLKYLIKSEINSDVNQWMFSQIPLEKHFYDMDFQFVIEVKRGNDFSGDYHVAIDDVEIRDFCQPIGSCDFEEDFCAFQNLGDLVYNRVNYSMWARAHGRSFFDFRAMPPKDDHTSGGRNGVYAYLDKGPVATLYTPYFAINDQMCLTFYYFLNVRLGGTIPTMIVELAQLNDNNTLSHMELAKIDGKSRATDLKQREWNKHTVTVNTKGNKMMLQFGGVINERDQFIALDDISLTPGACTTMKYKQFPCVANPKAKTDFVNYSKVCDFFSDCPNGADEQNCGYKCLISNPTCGWTVKNVTSTFLRVDLSNPKGISFKEKLPIRDHGSLGSGSYMQLYDQPGPFIDNPEANIESPWLQNTGPLCYFTIFYIIRDPHHESALLRVRLIEPNNPLGIEVFRDEGPTEGYYWKKADIVVGRIRGKFKIQINAQMKIVKGGAAIAIDDIELHQSECMIPVKAHPSTYRCSSKPYHCADKQFCFGEDNLCDYQDDCGDASDESPKYCETKNRVPLQCDFEDGICFWRINSHLNKTHLNGMRWGAIDDIDDYAYGIKRDHTLNNELGHVLYVWNEKKSIGRIESPLIQTNSSVTCQLRLFYLYKSKEVSWFTTDVNNKIGKLNVHIKSTLNGALFKLASVSYVRSSHFERLVVDLNMLKEPFYVVLEVVSGSDKFGIWAIDDVSFSSGCQPADSNAVTDPTFTPFPVTTASPNQCFNGTSFLCDKEVCIYANQVCDFSRDCNDGTDESNCGEDSFATGWTDQSQGRLSWNIDKKKGEVRSKVGDGIDSVAFMQSVKFGASGGSCSVMFNYFIDMNSESLSLNLVYTKGRLTKHAVLFNSRKSNTIQYNTWNLARIFIGEHEDGWQLQFVGRKEVVNNRTETIRLKNVKFSNCAWATFNYTNCDKQGYFTCDTGTCISKSQVCDYNDDCGDSSDEKNCKHQTSFRCSFESSRNVSGTCGLGLTDNKWKRFQGIDTRNFMGPGLDHTTDTERGHFMMVTGAVFGQSNSATQMETPTFDPDSSGNCHIRFWYMINGIGTLTISENVTGSTELKVIQAIDSTPNDTFVWRRFSEPLKSNKKPYKIVFSAKIADIKTKTFIAIDDISFTSACKHSKIPPKSNATTSSSVPHCSIGDQFECLDGSCITFDEVCDFYPTCPQGEDELDCPAFCDFENATVDDLCMWGTNSDDPNPLLIGISRENADSASELAQFYPPTDNTLKTNSGHFMFVYGLNYTYQVEPKLDLNILSAEYTSSSSSCMLSLDYYIAVDEGRNATATYVIALDEITDADGAKQYSLRQINIIDETLWNNWTTISVGIGRRENVFQLSIIRLHDPNMPESLAIDNIRFTNCAYTAPNDKNHSACRSDQFTCGNHFNCIPKEQVCDLQKDCPDGSDEACGESAGYELTFEAADGLNSTGFTVGKPFGILGDDVWNIVSGQAPQRAALETGPPFDHTYFNYKGHYLYTRPWDFGVDVWFISPMLKPTKQKCVLRFYYYMFGLNDNQINVYVRNQTQLNTVKVSTIKTKSQDIWRSATVQLQSPGSIFQFIISGVSGGDVASIAIDDVLLTPNCVFDDSKSTLPPGTVAPGTGTTLTTQATTPTATPSNPGSSCDIGLYACADNTCLPQITKCNFIADCSDGSDENAPDCTQQTCEPKTDQLNKECGMNIFLADGSNYTWAYSNSDNFTQQTNVHFVNMFSKFIYVDLSTGNQDDYSNLVTQMISETSPSCMLKFEYACDPNNCPLQVSIISHKNNADVKSLIWVPLNSEFIAQKSGYQVKEARIYIGRRNSFKVSIGSLKQQNVKSYVLLNEIKFENCLPAKYNSDPSSTTCTEEQFKCSKSYGNCIAQSAVCDYQQDCRLKEDESSCDSYIGRCNFENVDVCDFWQYEESDDRWTFITESGQHGIAYLPSIDHTGHTPNQYYLSFHSNLMSNYLGKKAPDQLFGAKIVSNIIMANVTNDCRFRFWYNLIGPKCQLKIYKRYSANENTLQQTVQSDMFDYWQKMELKLQEISGQARDFQIVIQALVGLKQPCSVNVDDVSFTPQCTNLFTPFLPPDVPNPNTTFGNLCKPNLMCHDKKCYSLKQRCNFVQDCDDGTDEESCPSSCTFDYDGSTTKMCGWYNPKGLQANFARTKGPSVGTRTGGTGPKADHTKGTADGYYIVARNFSTYNAKIQLHSPYFSTSGPNCRFSFAYFLNEPKHLDKINIFLKTTNHPTKFTKIWTYDPVKAYTKVWNQDSAYVGKQKAFSLILEATQGLKNSRADLAFDDFQFINCHQQSNDTDLFCAENEYRCDDLSQCIDYWRLCDGEMDCADGSDEDQHCTQTNGTCWFVDQNWKTHCNWVDLKKDFNFVYEAVSINATKDKETNTGPQTLLSDIYGYALMKAKGHKLGERAAIASPEFPASSGICSLSFHYYMYGSDSMGELTVYTLGQNGKRVDYFHITGNQGSQWNYVDNIMVGNPSPFRVVFEGIVGADQYSDIAIGYTSFSKDCAAGTWQEKANANLTLEGSCKAFYCHKSHECISRDWVCDGVEDCRDGTDEVNCTHLNRRDPKQSSKKALIITFSVLAVILAVAVPGLIYGYNRYVRPRSGDRAPFLDNSTFETTSHRDLDYTKDNSSSSKSNKTAVSFEMTTRRTNLKSD